MFCQYCGKELINGEVCECRKREVSSVNKENITKYKKKVIGIEDKQENNKNKILQPIPINNKENEIEIDIEVRDVKPKVKRSKFKKFLFFIHLLLGILSYVAIQICGTLLFSEDEIFKILLPYSSILLPLFFLSIAMLILISFISKKKIKNIMNFALIMVVVVIIAKLSIDMIINDKVHMQIQQSIFQKQEQEQILAEIKKLQAENDHASAIKLLKENKEIIDGNQMEELLEESMIQYKKEILSQVDEYVEQQDYESAVNLIDTATWFIGNDESLSEKHSEVEKEAVSFNITQLVEEENYVEAINYIKKNESILANDSFVTSKLSEITKQYRKMVIEEAENAYHEEDYSAAIEVINDALVILPNDQELLNEKELYNEMIPVKLTELKPYVGSLKETENYTDNMGNVYEKALVGYSTCDTAIYDIGMKYNVLKATVAVTYEPKAHNKIRGHIRIYGDDKVLWEDSQIINSTKPYPIEIDITGVTDLKVEMEGYGYWDGILRVILAEPVLQKITK